jgi:predicted oxidoreductase (fatty acid repression mutant protein)
MLQFAVWTALEIEGLGANLQHYNPLVDVKVAEQWKLPATWKLTAQLVFGGKAVAEAGEKTFLPLEEKFKVFGA